MFAGTGEGYFREEIRGRLAAARRRHLRDARRRQVLGKTACRPARRTFIGSTTSSSASATAVAIYAATRTGVWRSIDRGETWTRLLDDERPRRLPRSRDAARSADDVLFASCGTYEQARSIAFRAPPIDPTVEVVLRRARHGPDVAGDCAVEARHHVRARREQRRWPNGNYSQGLLAVYRSTRGGARGPGKRASPTAIRRFNTLLLTNVSGATVHDCSGNPNARNTYTNMGWYINVIAVDPRDPERVWAAASTGCDRTMAAAMGPRRLGRGAGLACTVVHVDQHGIAFHPGYDGSVEPDGHRRATTAACTASTNARGAATTGRRACGVLAGQPAGAVAVAQPRLRGDAVLSRLAFPDGTRYIGGTQDNGTILGGDDSGVDGWRGVLAATAASRRHRSDATRRSSTPNRSGPTSRERPTAAHTFTLTPHRARSVRSDVLGPEANYLFVTPFVMDPSNRSGCGLAVSTSIARPTAQRCGPRPARRCRTVGCVSAIAVVAGDWNASLRAPTGRRPGLAPRVRSERSRHVGRDTPARAGGSHRWRSIRGTPKYGLRDLRQLRRGARLPQR